MSKVILMMSMSLDGFIEGPHRELDWHMVDDGVVLLRYQRPDARGTD